MLHWEFRQPSPYDSRQCSYGFVDFGFERYEVTPAECDLLTIAFFREGFVGYSEQEGGWLLFCAGYGGRPELSVPTREELEWMPHLPPCWERMMVRVPHEE